MEFLKDVISRKDQGADLALAYNSRFVAESRPEVHMHTVTYFLAPRMRIFWRYGDREMLTYFQMRNFNSSTVGVLTPDLFEVAARSGWTFHHVRT